MSAKEFLKKENINDIIVNKEDLPEYHKTISDLMQEYHESKINDSVIVNKDYFNKINNYYNQYS